MVAFTTGVMYIEITDMKSFTLLTGGVKIDLGFCGARPFKHILIYY